MRTSLYADLSSYNAIWYVDTSPLSAGAATELETFVEEGGGLYLTGERPCCDALNSWDQGIVDTVVAGGGVQVGGLGDDSAGYGTEALDPNAIDGITTNPNVVANWTPSAPGMTAGVSGDNVISRTGPLRDRGGLGGFPA